MSCEMLILQVFFICQIVLSIIQILSHVPNSEGNPTGVEHLRKIEIENLTISQMRILAADLIEQDEFYNKDHFLTLWLRARDWNVSAATTMFRDAINWRKQNRIDSILNETIITFSVSPILFDGFDKVGRPLALFSPRFIDPRKLQLIWKREDLIRTFDQVMERGFHLIKNIKHSLTNGKPVTSFVAIMDFAGVTMKQYMCFRCVAIFVECALHFENYYPGALDLIIHINVNRFAVAVVKLLTPFVSIHSRNALKVYGLNRTEWSEYLLSIISPDQLPRSFGGTRISQF